MSDRLRDQNGRADQVAALLKLLANKQRLMIACLLAEGEHGVSQIEEQLGIRQPSLSQQLGALRQAGVIAGRREAKAVFYHLADPRIRQMLAALHDIFCPDGVAALVAAAGPTGRQMAFAGAAAFAVLTAPQE